MLAAFAPIWMITALGWAALRFGPLTRPMQQSLSGFAFVVAIPAVLFTTLVKVPFGQLALRPLIAFGLGTLAAGLLAYLVARWLLPGRVADRVIAAMASAYVNSGNLGIPVALYVLDDVSLITAVIAFQTMVLTPLIVGLLDADVHDGPGRWARIAMLPLRTPVVAAAIAGVVVSAAGWQPPEMVLRPLEILGGAAAPAALFALGMSLHRDEGYALGLPRAELSFVVILKIVLQPLVAYLAGRFLLGLDGPALLAVTLFAGLPTAQNTFVFAGEYRVPTELSRDAILVTSLLSMGSLSLIMWLVGPAS